MQSRISKNYLVEKKKPAIVDKDDFEYRDKSKVIAFFGIFGLSRFWCEEELNDLICQPISTIFKFSAEAIIEDTKPLDGENE